MCVCGHPAFGRPRLFIIVRSNRRSNFIRHYHYSIKSRHQLNISPSPNSPCAASFPQKQEKKIDAWNKKRLEFWRNSQNPSWNSIWTGPHAALVPACTEEEKKKKKRGKDDPITKSIKRDEPNRQFRLCHSRQSFPSWRQTLQPLKQSSFHATLHTNSAFISTVFTVTQMAKTDGPTTSTLIQSFLIAYAVNVSTLPGNHRLCTPLKSL